MTMRSLYEPLLVDTGASLNRDGAFDSEDFRNRSFVALAAYLLSGERSVAGQQRLPESVPEGLTAYVRECISRSRHPGMAPSIPEFVAEFEKRGAIPDLDSAQAGLALPERRGVPRAIVTTEPLESVGSVSDFDEDNIEPDTSWSEGQGSGSYLDTPKLGLRLRKNPLKGRVGLWVLGAVLLLVAFIVYALFAGSGDMHDDATSSRSSQPAPVKPSPAPAVSSPAPVAPSPAPVAPSPPVVAPLKKETPPVNPQAGNPASPEEIRPALVPSAREKEELRRQQQNKGAFTRQIHDGTRPAAGPGSYAADQNQATLAMLPSSRSASDLLRINDFAMFIAKLRWESLDAPE
jgi:hypothetical protein